MTRGESILTEYVNRHKCTILSKRTKAAIMRTEYNNYTELMDFCGEQSKPIDIWLNEIITPKTTK